MKIGTKREFANQRRVIKQIFEMFERLGFYPAACNLCRHIFIVGLYTCIIMLFITKMEIVICFENQE